MSPSPSYVPPPMGRVVSAQDSGGSAAPACACPTRMIVYLALAEGVWLGLLVAGPILASVAREHFRDLGVVLPRSTTWVLNIARTFELPAGVLPTVVAMMVISSLFVVGLMASRGPSMDIRALVGRLSILAIVLGLGAWIGFGVTVGLPMLSAMP